MTAGAALDAAAHRLRAAGAPEPDAAKADARLLLAHVLGCDSAWLLAHDRDALDAASSTRFQALVERRAAGEPVAYILGTWGFYGRSFAVDRNVLVPRPATEVLVDMVLEFAAARAHEALEVLDVGTGSGALALTLALELPRARVTATDVSTAALDVARRNAGAFGIGERVAFFEGDLLTPLPGRARYDVVVANLPYVPTGALAPHPDPTSFEPRLALDGGPDGHALYRRLLASLPARLSGGALVLLESDGEQTAALAELAAAQFPGARIEIRADFGGRPRVVSVRLAD